MHARRPNPPHISVPTRLATLALGVGITVALAGCQKAGEAASERAAEKMIEAQMAQSGGSAKVDLSDGKVTAEGVDAQGRAYKMEMGSAQLTEQEIGLPFYPGAKPVDNAGTRVRNGNSQMMSQELAVDASAKEVSAWYREQMKKRSEGTTFIDNPNEDGGVNLAIIDGAKKENMNVEVSANGASTRIVLIHAKGE